MPSCKICLKRFPLWMSIDGQKHNLQNRKHCLSCLPWKQAKPLIDKSKLQVCTKCGKNYNGHQKASKKRFCATCVVNANRTGRKRKLVQLKGGLCQKCGYKRSLNALQFHHRDPKQKKFTITISNCCRKLSELIEEAQKCDLLCANCHAELHDIKPMITGEENW